jgi:hypothetical protein
VSHLAPALRSASQRADTRGRYGPANDPAQAPRRHPRHRRRGRSLRPGCQRPVSRAGLARRWRERLPGERYLTIGVNVIRYPWRRLQAAERELEAMAYQRVDQRLARKLIDLGQRFGVKTERGTLIQARLTQQELAEMIGTARETLTHALSDFRRRGILDTERHQVWIRDAERLAEVAEGDEL